MVPAVSLPVHDALFVMATEHEYGPQLRRRIEPLVTGVGPIEAGIATAARLGELHRGARLPELVVSLGSAASRRHPVGSVWQVASVSWRDMDASRLGFEKGRTPFLDQPATIALATPIDGTPSASLSTGAAVVGDAELQALAEDLADMETFAVVRAGQRFDVPVIGLRGVSDGPEELSELSGWTDQLAYLDEVLAEAIDVLQGPRRPG